MAKLLYGVGVNDAGYAVTKKVKSKRVVCPFYIKWANMLKRCYCPEYQKKKPTYIGCSVVEEWLSFSNFKAWMEGQDWEGKQLDKDILIPDNKVYGPDTCIFVTPEINALLISHVSDRGKYLQGVCIIKGKGYMAQCSVEGTQYYLGHYSTPEAASKVYLAFKAGHIIGVAQEQKDPRLKAALAHHADRLLGIDDLI